LSKLPFAPKLRRFGLAQNGVVLGILGFFFFLKKRRKLKKKRKKKGKIGVASGHPQNPKPIFPFFYFYFLAFQGDWTTPKGLGWLQPP
jgi:hypothetical protein